MAAKEAEQKALADRLKESVAEVAAAKAEIGKLEKAQEDLKAQHAKVCGCDCARDVWLAWFSIHSFWLSVPQLWWLYLHQWGIMRVDYF